MSIRIVRALQLLITILVPLLIVFGGARVLATDQYLAYEYGKPNFPLDRYGFSRDQRLALAATNLRYVREGLPIEALASQQIEGRAVYDPRELKHMQDVQAVFQVGVLAWNIGLVVALAAALVLGRTEPGRRALAAAFKAGGLITTGLVGAIGLLAVVAWQLWFVAFHRIFFQPGTWTFQYTDTLIRLFPERFWFDAAVTVAVGSVTAGLLVSAVGWRLLRPRQAAAQALLPHS